MKTVDEVVEKIEKLMLYRGSMPEEGKLREILNSLLDEIENEILYITENTPPNPNAVYCNVNKVLEKLAEMRGEND